MELFWSFWVLLNYMFWVYVACDMKQTTSVHLYAAIFLGTLTGIFPMILYYILKLL